MIVAQRILFHQDVVVAGVKSHLLDLSSAATQLLGHPLIVFVSGLFDNLLEIGLPGVISVVDDHDEEGDVESNGNDHEENLGSVIVAA
jgi:hypothetical protein